MAVARIRSTTAQLAAHPVRFLFSGIGWLLFASLIAVVWPLMLVATHSNERWPRIAAIVVIAVASPLLMYLLTLLAIRFLAEALILFALVWRSLRAADPLAPLAMRETDVGARAALIQYVPLQRTRWSGLLESVRQTSSAFSPWRRFIGFDLIWLAATAAAGLPWAAAPLLTALLVAVPALAGASLLAWNRARGGHVLDDVTPTRPENPATIAT